MLTLVGMIAEGVVRLAFGLLGILVGTLIGIGGGAARAACAGAAVGQRALAPGFVASRAALRYVVIVFGILISLFAGALAWGYLTRERTADEFAAAGTSALSPVLYDADHHFVGIYNPAWGGAGQTEPDFAKYVTVWEAKPAPHLWSCLSSLEDRRFKTWVLAIGFDPVAVGRTLLGFVTGRGGGGSTLLNQLARSMRGRTPSDAEAPLEKLRRKLAEWSDSPALVLLFRSGNVDPERFVTANLPLLAGAPGSRAGNLPYGAEAASLILFGHPAADLKADEQYLLAAADWRPILLAPDDNPSALESVDKRWAALQKRASRCLHLLGEPGTPAYDEAKQHLLAMRPPRLKDDIISASDDASGGFTTAVNPIRRARQLLGDGGLGLVGRDLADAATESWRGRLAKIDLSLNAAQNREFGEQIEKALADIEQRLGARLRLRLTGPNDAADRAQVIVVVTDLDSNILRYFEAGPAHGFDTARPVASIGKALVAAPVLGHAGDTGETFYCNRSVPGVHNAGGHEGAATCRSPHAWVRARDAYAKSLTLAFINRLSAVPPDTLRQTAKSLGFTLPADVPPETSVPLGLFEATPRSVLQAMTGIGHVLAEMSGDVPSPRLVRQLGIISTNGSVLDQTATLRSSLAGADLLNNVAPAAEYLRQVLAAPLGTGGTLAALGAYRADDNPGLRFHAAKTGTSTTPDGMTRDAMIAGTFQTSDARGFAYFILAGTADPRHPLGSVNGGSFAQLARVVLEQAVIGDMR